MIAAKHDKGKVVITTEDFDEFGDKQRTNRYITMEDAQRLHKEISEALSACREYIGGQQLKGYVFVQDECFPEGA